MRRAEILIDGVWVGHIEGDGERDFEPVWFVANLLSLNQIHIKHPTHGWIYVQPRNYPLRDPDETQ